jgi:hypothetical protein
VKSYKDRQNQKLYESAHLPLLRTEKKSERIGNELKDVQTGGTILKSPFQEKADSFKKKLTEPPDKNKKALGDLGMEKIGKSTFKSDPSLKAGRTPTLSKGVPVNEIAMTGSDMKSNADQQIQQMVAMSDPITQRVVDIIDNKPIMQLQRIAQELSNILPLLIQRQNPVLAKKYIRGERDEMKDMYRQYGQVQPMPQVMPPQVGQAGTAHMAACKKV